MLQREGEWREIVEKARREQRLKRDGRAPSSQTTPLHAGYKSRGQSKMPKQRLRFVLRSQQSRGGSRSQCNHGTLSDRILICDNWRILPS